LNTEKTPFDKALDYIIEYIEDRTSTSLINLAGEINQNQNLNLIKRINRLAKSAFESLCLPDCFNYYEMAKFLGNDKSIKAFYKQRENVLFFFMNPKIVFDSSDKSTAYALIVMDIDFYADIDRIEYNKTKE